jgi:hypothetical protein
VGEEGFFEDVIVCGAFCDASGLSAHVTECPANNNILKKTFFSHTHLSAFNDEKENLLDPTCAKSFPELNPYPYLLHYRI